MAITELLGSLGGRLLVETAGTCSGLQASLCKRRDFVSSNSNSDNDHHLKNYFCVCVPVVCVHCLHTGTWRGYSRVADPSKQVLDTSELPCGSWEQNWVLYISSSLNHWGIPPTPVSFLISVQCICCAWNTNIANNVNSRCSSLWSRDKHKHFKSIRCPHIHDARFLMGSTV